MTEGNVYFNKSDLQNPGDADDPDNALPLLAPGQYAVVGSREVTRFGQTTASAAPTYPYSPVEHRFQFSAHGAAATPRPFRFDFFDFANTRMSPRFPEDDPAAAFDVNQVVPITCAALYPHEVPGSGRTDWSDYVTNNPADEIVDMGFNISAPLSGPDYYPAPTDRISAGSRCELSRW